MKLLLIILAGIALLSACRKDSNYDAFTAPIVTYVISDTANLLADDTTTFTVTVNTEGAQDSSYFTPSFPAAGGKILGIDSGGNAYIINNTTTFQVQVSQAPGLYPLNIQYETNKLSFIEFNILTRPALADYLLVESSALDINTATPANITFTVVPKRYHGAVSTGYSVNARAYQLNNGDTVDDSYFVGLANNSVSNGQITITYVPDPANFTLPPPVYVEFYAPTNEGTVTQTTFPLLFP
jgi:hypothetical protein